MTQGFQFDWLAQDFWKTMKGTLKPMVQPRHALQHRVPMNLQKKFSGFAMVVWKQPLQLNGRWRLCQGLLIYIIIDIAVYLNLSLTSNPWVPWSMSWLTTWFWFRDCVPPVLLPAAPQCQSPEAGQSRSPFSRTCQIGLAQLPSQPKIVWFWMGILAWEFIQNLFFG